MMSHFARHTVLAAAALCVAGLVSFAGTIRADDAWQTLLKLQLEDSHKCVMSGIIFARELPVGDAIAYSGRAKCFDGREFDFSQDKPHMKFSIQACEPTVC